MSWREALENSAAIQFLNDMGGRIRYGVPTSEKEAMAISGQIPGHDPRNAKTGVGHEIEQRRAAAYLFGKNYPNLGPEWQSLIDRMRSGDDPKVLAVTQTAVEQGAADAQKAQQAALKALLAKYGSGTLGGLLGVIQ